jgi:23S rRNA (cytosine1962-C5)-methyltransferase
MNANTTIKVSVKKGREWQILRGHPWLFSGGISQTPGKVKPGDIVDLLDTSGKFVARGYYNPNCDIAVRILTLDAEQAIDKTFISERVRLAIELRERTIDLSSTNVYRLINAEGDFLPGLIVDRFDDLLVVQSHTAGGDALTAMLLDVLKEVIQPEAIILRNDALARRREGLNLEPARIVHGEIAKASGLRLVKENNFPFSVDPLGGQKTGFFTDQRDKRQAVMELARHFAKGARLANLFCYSGAFTVYAAKANEALLSVNIDESKQALDLAQKNFSLNQLSEANHQLLESDGFTWLEETSDRGDEFDFVILDPPAFAKSLKDKDKALRAYTRLNRLGLLCTKKGGFMLTCSCSGSISMDELQDCLNAAQAAAGRHVQILAVFKHGSDHPVSLAAKETEYLKVLLVRVL